MLEVGSDRVSAGVSEPRQSDMRLEVATLGRQPGLARGALVCPANMAETLLVDDEGEDRARLMTAEASKPVQPESEGRELDPA